MLPADLIASAPAELVSLIETEHKYDGYVRRQVEHNRRLADRLCQPIPRGTDFNGIHGLRAETRQKLCAAQPATLAQAGAIAGITHADLSIISIWLTSKQLRRRYSDQIST
jgi:tRNA uridine 5-carboxymethylaminomethyl modification enzyme